MAEIAVSLAREKLLPLLKEKANLLMSLNEEFEEIKDLLESIQAFLKDADRRAAIEDDSTNDGIRKWVKLLTEEAFRIEDVIDEYIVHVAQRPHDPGCEALLCDIVHFIQTLIIRHQIATEIRDIKSSVLRIKKRSANCGIQIQPSFDQKRPNSSTIERQNVNWQHPLRNAYRYVEEDQLVSFEIPIDELIGWLVEGRAERTVISVVGMGGVGKTTLAKKIFDNQKVIEHFNCHAWFTVSQSYKAEVLLRDMLEKFCKDKGKAPPRDILEMSRDSLIEQVRSYLHKKRYVLLFDDVWNKCFWDDIKFAVVDNKNKSRILITTRNMDVAVSCKESSFVRVYELQPLIQEESLKLFYKKAFRFDFDGLCPEEFIDISSEIVAKCNGLPLAIVSIGGLLASRKNKNPFEWRKFSQSLSSELKKETRLTDVTKILSFSYDDLPDYLKPCLLYFGIYPEDYVVKSKRLIRQWVAEGFVANEEGESLEDVGEQYLSDLISRNLVQVSTFTLDGKAASCHVHDLLHDMIRKKVKDLSFCHYVREDDESVLSGIVRRLSITSSFNYLMGSIKSSHVRSLLVFKGGELPDDFGRILRTKYKLLRLLDFDYNVDFDCLDDLKILIHLKYLSFWGIHELFSSLENSICKLQNLETLDLRTMFPSHFPMGVSKLRKLQHLLGYRMPSTELKDGIGGMTSLQTLYEVEIIDDGVELIRELGKLKQLRHLGLAGVREELGRVLCSSINEMRHLEKLSIKSSHSSHFDVLDLHFISSPPPMLRKLCLQGKLNKLPQWVPQLQNLVKLSLDYCFSVNDPFKLLQNMPNLLSLDVMSVVCSSEVLHFRNGAFRKLKELHLRRLSNLFFIVFHEGALHSLNKLTIFNMLDLETVPFGIQYLKKLEVLNLFRMSDKFVQRIKTRDGKKHSVFEHVPLVTITRD